MPQSEQDTPSHFKGKDAIGHVIEAQAQGLMASAEIHGTEVPGHISAFADSSRETSLALLFVWTILTIFPAPFPQHHIATVLAIFALAWAVWKTGRSAWLGWSRLERLHRVLAQERWEIEHHRQQERSELKELYAAKGFEGKLLEDVLDVLMADDNRLLHVMVEEELGLSVESHEHPLKQALGAFFGCVIGFLACLIGLWIYPAWGIAVTGLILIGATSALTSLQAKNKVIPAIVWNVGLAALSFSCLYFLLQYLSHERPFS